jgi:molybdopterin-biosynthesis enzyme MoeA-like protein
MHEPSWTRLSERLARFGVPVAESNRRQCLFPEGSQVIANSAGTADAFSYEMAGKGFKLWALPGPPREIEAVWREGVEAGARAALPPQEPLRLLTWGCLGKSEAELGELTERALAGSGLKTGYRAHRPYVEIKVWCTAEDMRTKAGYLEKLEGAIGPWIAIRQGEDLATRLLEELGRGDARPEVELLDCATAGVLAERLGTALRRPGRWPELRLLTEWAGSTEPRAWLEAALSETDPESITLAITTDPVRGQWMLGLREAEKLLIEDLPSPYPGIHPEVLERARRYAAEAALKRWVDWLRERPTGRG